MSCSCGISGSDTVGAVVLGFHKFVTAEDVAVRAFAPISTALSADSFARLFVSSRSCCLIWTSSAAFLIATGSLMRCASANFRSASRES